MSPALSYASNCASERFPPSLLNPPIAMTGTPPAASSSEAALCEPKVAAAQRYPDAPDFSAAASSLLAVASPGPPPLHGRREQANGEHAFEDLRHEHARRESRMRDV